MSETSTTAAAVERDVRGVLIAISNSRLLLPNASVAEIITLSDPESVPQAPAWLLGRVRWRGWRIPVISFSRLAGLADEKGRLGAKVVVIKALGGNPKLPFFAVLAQGFPRLVSVSRDRLVETGDGKSHALGVKVPVLINDDSALIPDLTMIEMLLDEAMFADTTPATSADESA